MCWRTWYAQWQWKCVAPGVLKVCLEGRGLQKGCFYKRPCWDSEQYFTFSADWMYFTFFPVQSFEVICQWLCAVAGISTSFKWVFLYKASELPTFYFGVLHWSSVALLQQCQTHNGQFLNWSNWCSRIRDSLFCISCIPVFFVKPWLLQYITQNAIQPATVCWCYAMLKEANVVLSRYLQADPHAFFVIFIISLPVVFESCIFLWDRKDIFHICSIVPGDL